MKISGAIIQYRIEHFPDPPTPPTEEYFLTFSSPNSFTLLVESKGWDGKIQYSLDKETWSAWNGSTALNSNTNNELYIRGIGNTYITGYDSQGIHIWLLNGNNISCNGNIETILDYETVANGNHPVMADDCFYGLFRNQTALIKAPRTPATTLSTYCYEYMFANTGVTVPNELPALELTNYCYYRMYYNCANLMVLNNSYTGYTKQWRVPTEGTGTTSYSTALSNMFQNTSSDFVTPQLNTTYYIKDDE